MLRMSALMCKRRIRGLFPKTAAQHSALEDGGTWRMLLEQTSDAGNCMPDLSSHFAAGLNGLSSIL